MSDMPKIDVDNDKNVRFGKYIAIILGIFLSIVLLSVFAFKGCNSLGEKAGQGEFKIPTDTGLIAKSKTLFSKLLNDTASVTNLSTLADFQKKYPALKFALPYEWTNEAYKEDLRLVGIDEKLLPKKDREFYYNSRLPELLEQQRKNLDMTIFKIKIEDNKIAGIELIPSMFKVALTHNPWTGKITGKPSELFPDSNYVFLVYENTVLPIKKVRDNNWRNGELELNAIKTNNRNGLFQNNNKPIDYYEYYRQQVQPQPIKITFRDTETRDRINLKIKFTNTDTLRIETPQGNIRANIRAYDSNGDTINLHTRNNAGGITEKRCRIENNTKFVVYIGKRKVGEFLITHYNPLNDLSYLIKTNKGRERVTIDTAYTDIFTQQVTRKIQERANSQTPQEINLALDPMLSKAMEKELRHYVDSVYGNYIANHNSGEDFEISLTIMNAATGEVLAAPFYSTQTAKQKYIYNRKNPNLVRRYIGSTFKPLMTLSAILTYPDLLNLNTVTLHNRRLLSLDGDRATLAGLPIYKSFSETGHYADFWNGTTTMSEFLTKSDDVYPVALTMYAMNEKYYKNPNTSHRQPILNNYSDLNNNNQNNDLVDVRNNNSFMFPADRFDQQGQKKEYAAQYMFIQLLDELYGINSFAENTDNETDLPDYYIWQHLNNSLNIDKFDRRYIFSEISPDITNMRYDMWENQQKGTISNELRPWVLGQGNNEWNNVKVAQAWATVATKRKIRASMLKIPTDFSYMNLSELVKQKFNSHFISEFYNSTAEQIDNDINNFLGIWEQSQRNDDVTPNTLKAFRRRVDTLGNANNLNQNFVVLAKTGTPDDYPREDMQKITTPTVTYDVGMFSFALMTETQYNNIRQNSIANNAPRGIVCVVRIVHTYQKESSVNVGSVVARDFFSVPLLRKIYDFTQSCLGN